MDKRLLTSRQTYDGMSMAAAMVSMKRTFLILLCLISGLLSWADDAAKKADPLNQSTVSDSWRKGWMRAEDAQQKMGPLLQSIRAALTKGWSVTYDSEHSYLEIQRDEPVLGILYGPNMSIDDFKPKLSTYHFSFRVVDYVTPVQYQRWFTENAKTQKEADVIFADFEKRHLYGKGDKLWPKTDAGKAAAARYDQLIKSKRDLPDFYFQEVSIRWQHGSPEMDNLQEFYLEDERIRDECSQVRERVSKLFSKYPDP